MTAPRHPHDRRAVRLDPDPLHVEPEPVSRLPLCRRCGDLLEGPTERRNGLCMDCIGRGESVFGWLVLIIVAITAGAIVALLMWGGAAPRGGSEVRMTPGLPGASPPAVGSGAPLRSWGSVERPSKSWSAVGSSGQRPDSAETAGGGAPSSVPDGSSTEVGEALAVYRGTATWYCSDGRDGSPRSTCTAGYGPDDLVAAIDRKDTEFRKGDHVLVTFGDRSVIVTIVDTCACADARVIDLTIGAFGRLAPWGLGVLPVTLQRVPTLPDTDGEP